MLAIGNVQRVAHVVCYHSEPLGPPQGVTQNLTVDHPPYLLPDSEWEDEYRKIFPNGWKALTDAVGLTLKGDLRTLKYIGELNPEGLFVDDGTPAKWKAIHEAARSGHLEILQYLVEEIGFDVNEPCLVTNAETPLAIAYENQGRDHPVSRYLESKGGIIKETKEDDSVKTGAPPVNDEL